MICEECKKTCEQHQPFQRFCSPNCRLRWNRRNARFPAEAAARSRQAAADLLAVIEAHQNGQLTRGEYSESVVHLIQTRFASVYEALTSLGNLALDYKHQAQDHPAGQKQEKV